MLSLPIVLLSCALVTAQTPAESVKLNITLNGAVVGQNVYDLQPDGTFKSVTDLSVSSTLKIHSELSGKYEQGRLVQYKGSVAGQGPTATIVFDHGKMTAEAGGVKRDLPIKVGNEPYFGNLHPQFTASVLKSIDFAKKTSQIIKCFMPDAGSFMSPKITPEEAKSTPLGQAKMFDVQSPPLAIEFALDGVGHVVAMDVPMQKLRFLAPGWEALYTDPLAKYPELSQPSFGVKVEIGVKMRTRDGVDLAADVYRPDVPGKFPAILERTPYGREGGAIDGAFYAKRGYIVVSQDCRGRGDSGGDWDPLVHERKDGYDAVQGTAKLPWCDGNVGMIGGSYGGLVQWTAAVEQPPALKCIVPQVSPPDAFLNLPYDNGIFFLYGAVWWSKVVAGRGADLSSLMKALPNPDGFSKLPLSAVCQAVLGKDVPFYSKWVSRTRSSDWTGFNYEGDLKKVTIPALNISGWWDGDLPGTMTNWSIMRSLGRTNQWLIYGPWSHLFNSTSKMGDIDFGPTAVIDLDSIYLRWFDTWLKHKSVGMQKIPHVRVFITGANKWVESTDWPLAGTSKKTLYFEADGPADGSSTHGRMLDAPLTKEAPSKYTFDPKVAKIDKRLKDPDPNKASFIINVGKHDPGGLFFKSNPMTADTVVSAPLTVTVSFSTSAYDTDFFASMVDVDPSGKVHALGEAGKIRCSYLGGFDKQVALRPSRIYEAKMRLWDFAHQFKKGHRIGILLRSEAFPMFARNLGTLDPIRSATRTIVQNQKIYHDARHPSKLTFQVSQ